MNTTNSTSIQTIKRSWFLIDAKDEIVGRLASKIALLLMGKNKPYFVRHLDCGDNVVVINSKYIVLSGKKELNKSYHWHSGYPGGFKSVTASKVRLKNPNMIIKQAVKGMLPVNKLRDRMMTRLNIYPDQTHPFAAKFK